MALNNLSGVLLASVVLFLMMKTIGPKWKVHMPRKRRRQRRTVKVDPLVARERRLASELRHVRAQIKERDSSVRHG